MMSVLFSDNIRKQWPTYLDISVYRRVAFVTLTVELGRLRPDDEIEVTTHYFHSAGHPVFVDENIQRALERVCIKVGGQLEHYQERGEASFFLVSKFSALVWADSFLQMLAAPFLCRKNLPRKNVSLLLLKAWTNLKNGLCVFWGGHFSSGQTLESRKRILVQ